MTDTAHPHPGRWWTHRRIQAYWAMVALTVAFALALAGKIPPSSHELVEGLCWVFGFVVFAYYGGNAAQDFATAIGRKR